MVALKDVQNRDIVDFVRAAISDFNDRPVPVETVHHAVECALDRVDPAVAKCYRDYRNYKQDFVHMLDDVYVKSQSIRYLGDRDNANTDSALVPTQRSLIYNELSSALYKKFFLNREEREAMKDGYIYIHDRSARLDTMNCFRRDTRFITSSGVKSFYDFKDGDEVVVKTHLGNWKKATVHSYGYQPIQKVVFKQGVPTSKPHEVYCTANHRWILKDGSETTNLTEGDILWQVPDGTKLAWDHMTSEQKRLWCTGFAVGDGSLIGTQGGSSQNRYVIIRLCGDKVKYADRFRDCGFSVTSPQSVAPDMMVHMLHMSSKKIPYLDLNHKNAIYFMNGLLCADGNKREEGASSEFRGIQVTGALNNYISDLLNVAGYYVTSQRDITEKSTNYGTYSDTTILYHISSSQNRSSAWRVDHIEYAELNHNAQVWCLDVEDDHSFILEGGIPTGNCCLFDMEHVLSGGFEMGNVWYNEPKTLDVAFDVISDVAISAAACQYGGFTIPECDKLLAPYAKKSFDKYWKEFYEIMRSHPGEIEDYLDYDMMQKANDYAMAKVRRDMDQGFQSWEYRFNTVGSSRGDYPFIAISFGLADDVFGRMATESCLAVRAGGQGADGHKKPVLFPKLTFLYDENLHGKGKPMEYLFECAIDCSAKAMYPDFLSLTGEGYIPSMYKKYGRVVSLMGCRASLSPWYERGGMGPADDEDKPVFVGRFNIGAISLHLPMILAKSRQENRDFYEVLDYYLELIRKLHQKTYDYLAEKRASTNPLGFCQGGFLGGTLQPDEKIGKLLPAMTASFGITALNELQELYNGKSLVEDGQFALEVMEHINDKVNAFKAQDHILYAIYGTPAESLCGLQIEQFRKMYGIVKGVSDRPYVSNSFHCGVWEDITPPQKQDFESRFWNLFNGGKIQYCRYPVSYNKEAIRTLVRRAMQKGFYEGINLSLAYCEECGYEQLDMDVCPKCGSSLITKIDRMNGYLGYTRVHGKTRYNDAKNAEIAERKSM